MSSWVGDFVPPRIRYVVALLSLHQISISESPGLPTSDIREMFAEEYFNVVFETHSISTALVSFANEITSGVNNQSRHDPSCQSQSHGAKL